MCTFVKKVFLITLQLLYRMQIFTITSLAAIIIASAQAALPLTNKGCQCLSDCQICSQYHSVSSENYC